MSLRPFFLKQILTLVSICCLLCLSFTSCTTEEMGDPTLLRHTRLELVDWHISGFGIINCPVAWLRVTNYNRVAIRDIVLKYTTYNYEGHLLNEGTYTLEDPVAPGRMKNFIELYLGLVDLQTEKLSVQIQSVQQAE